AAVAIVAGFAARGLNDYYAIRWRSPVEIDMFKKLNKAIAPDQALLTYYDYFVQEYPDKPGLYRPEVAWYLDRPMSVARTLDEVAARAATGFYPFYLVDMEMAPPALLQALKARYPFEYVQGNPYVAEPHEIYPYPDQMIFDLEQPAGGPMTLDLGADGLMKLGLDALYRARDPRQAARYFRRVLVLNSEHFGANFQLAKSLDAMGADAAALPYWTKTLALARAYKDAATAAQAEARLARER
ncbi:MAG TPA: hypothetical protein VN915_10720, partial [Elusimicrobiota bacterium]|nr:hypothetical protein [Elusimicrobiota bacterium]